MKFYEMEDENAAAAEVIRKIKVKEEFDEEELQELKYYFGEYDEVFYENRRWTRSVTTIFKLDDNVFIALEWEEGLTEYQPNEYYEQPYFVYPKEEHIVVTNWYRKEDE